MSARAFALRAREVLAAYVWDNPVFLKEYRLQFRSNRTYLLHFSYLFMLGTALTILVLYAHLSSAGGGRVALWKVGQWTFSLVIGVHAIFLAGLMSTMASSSVTAEKEARTWEMIECLPMSAGRFVTGKFTSLIMLTGLLILSSMPLFLLALSFVGGVGALDILGAYLSLLGLSAACASGGILASAVSDNSRAAQFLCMRVLFLVLITGWFGGALLFVFVSSLTGRYAASALASSQIPFVGSSPLAALLMVGVNASASSLLLTAAADRLRAPEDKRPYQLLSQIFAVLAAGAAALTGGAAVLAAGSSGASGSAMFDELGYMILQATGLVCLTVLVLPTPDRPQRGWRALFSTGPFYGSVFLFLCLFATDGVLAAVKPFFPALPAPASGLLGFADWLKGQAMIAGALIFCAGLARLAFGLSERLARGLYFGALILSYLLPLLVHSLLFRGSFVLWVTPLLWLNPWVALSQIDAQTAEAVLRALGVEGGGAPGLLGLAVECALGAGLYLLGARLEARRARSTEPAPTEPLAPPPPPAEPAAQAASPPPGTP